MREGRTTPEPLRFETVKDAKVHIKANKMKVKQTVRHARGARIQVVDAKGKPRTISIETRKNGNAN